MQTAHVSVNPSGKTVVFFGEVENTSLETNDFQSNNPQKVSRCAEPRYWWRSQSGRATKKHK